MFIDAFINTYWATVYDHETHVVTHNALGVKCDNVLNNETLLK